MLLRYPEDAQTLHAELQALLLASEASRSWSHLAGSFTTKEVHGRDYVYFQYSDVGGKKRQLAIGPHSASLEATIEEYRQRRASRTQELEQLQRLAGLLRSAGWITLPHAPARVIRGLAEAGVFQLGGILVGSYAFILLGNALGLQWDEASWRTRDVDVAGGMQVATPALEADVPKALESLQMGFVPVPKLDPRMASTSFKVRGKQLRVDLITPGMEGMEEPVYIPRFKAAAAPIKYLSLLIEETFPVAAVHATGAELVTVPNPAHYALHKLLVSQSRSMVQQVKSSKDLHQAALLLEALAEDRPDDLQAAAARFRRSGPPVTTRIGRALGSVAKRWPDAGAGVDLARATLGGG